MDSADRAALQHRRRPDSGSRVRAKPVGATLKELGQGFAIVLLVCAVLTFILEVNFRGFFDSSTAFEAMTPATRFAFFVMPGVGRMSDGCQPLRSRNPIARRARAS